MIRCKYLFVSKHDVFMSHISSSLPVQNGAVTQKDTLNDDEFEPYLNTQARQVSPPDGLKCDSLFLGA